MAFNALAENEYLKSPGCTNLPTFSRYIMPKKNDPNNMPLGSRHGGYVRWGHSHLQPAIIYIGSQTQSLHSSRQPFRPQCELIWQYSRTALSLSSSLTNNSMNANSVRLKHWGCDTGTHTPYSLCTRPASIKDDKRPRQHLFTVREDANQSSGELGLCIHTNEHTCRTVVLSTWLGVRIFCFLRYIK